MKATTINSEIRNNVPIDQYHAKDGFISSSALKQARKSLRYFKAYMDGKIETEKKQAFEFGNAFELALCSPIEYTEKVIVFNENDRPEKDKGITSKANQEWKHGILNGDKYVITQADNEAILAMIASGEKNNFIQKLLAGSSYQISFFWQCAETGLKMKARPDLLRHDKKTIIDIKTAHTAEPGLFANDAAKYGYPLQAMMQIEGAGACGIEIEHYFWLVYEKSEPFDVVLYEFSPEDRQQQEGPYYNLKKRVADAIEYDNWPGYSASALNDYGILPLEIPKWFSI